jgi:hypothetical protein
MCWPITLWSRFFFFIVFTAASMASYVDNTWEQRRSNTTDGVTVE